MRLVAPAGTAEILTGKTVDNLFLRLYGLLPEDLYAGTSGDKAKVRTGILLDMQADANSLLDPILLAALAARQGAAAESLRPLGYMVEQFTLRLTSNLICGMANYSLLGAGMSLLRPYGIPVVPASTVKGVTASWLGEILAGSLGVASERQEALLRAAGLLDAFGWGESIDPNTRALSEGAAAQIVVFDALPVVSALETDITTVHHQDWYQGENGVPAGFETPTPIPFLTVKQGSCFHFALAVKSELAFHANAAAAAQLSSFGIASLESPGKFLREAVVSAGLAQGIRLANRGRLWPHGAPSLRTPLAGA